MSIHLKIVQKDSFSFFIHPFLLFPDFSAGNIAPERGQRYNDSIMKENKLPFKIKENIELITDASSANEFASRINEFEHVGRSLNMARNLFSAKVKALGLVFDKETKTYADKAA